tara:strand:- start:476 stop:730 length:255 start_codon:yes stop_codon:yes gene_type:complete
LCEEIKIIEAGMEDNNIEYKRNDLLLITDVFPFFILINIPVFFEININIRKEEKIIDTENIKNLSKIISSKIEKKYIPGNADKI